MAITYVNDLRLSEMDTGDNSGTWGTVTNTNLELIGEALGYGTEAITTNADTHASVIADGSTDPVRSMYVKYTGTLDSACTITISPNTVNKFYYIENATSGSQNIIISQGSGANVTIPAGDTKAVYLDGAGSGAAVTDAFASLSVVDLKVQDDLTVTDDVAIGGLATVGGTLGVTGVVTANAGVVVDNITIDGTEIDLSSGDLTIDVAGDINLDSGDGDIQFKDAGTTFMNLYESSNNAMFYNPISDADIRFQGKDNTTVITALSLDMSEAGSATFNHDVFLPSAGNLSFTSGGFNPRISNSNSDTALSFFTNNSERFQIGTDGSLSTPTAGTSNVRFGVNAGDSIQSGGNYNVVVGDEAGTALTTGDESVLIGFQAGDSISTGTQNVAIGSNALGAGITATNNVAVGRASMAATLGSENVAVGVNTLNSNQGGSHSVAIGSSALLAQNPSSGNVDFYNTAVGSKAGTNLSTGLANTFIGGLSAGDGTVTGDHNTALGSETLYRLTSGQSNVAIGYQAGSGLLAGSYNVAIGREALETEDDHNGNVAIGYRAMRFLNAAQNADNTAIGYQTMQSMTLGIYNVAIGRNALEADDLGSRNVAIGNYALKSQNAPGSSANNMNNVAVGYDAGGGVVEGYYNTFLGYQAGDGLVSGNSNVCVGKDADTDNTSRVGATALGAGIGTHAADNSFRVNGAGGVYNTGNTSTWNTTSDERIKKNITDSTVGLAEVNQIRVRNFEYRTADEITDSSLQEYDLDQLAIAKTGTQVGCIAQELKQIIPSAVVVDDRGVNNVQDDEIKWHMIKAIQELSAKNDALEARLAVLEG